MEQHNLDSDTDSSFNTSEEYLNHVKFYKREYNYVLRHEPANNVLLDSIIKKIFNSNYSKDYDKESRKTYRKDQVEDDDAISDLILKLEKYEKFKMTILIIEILRFCLDRENLITQLDFTLNREITDLF